MTSGTPSTLPTWFLPTAQVAAAALFTDELDRILLVKPTYNDAWNLPGGVVEPGESPSAAATREAIGLDVQLGTRGLPG